MTPPYDRRRAEDVYRALEADVFPRLEKMEDKISATEGAVHQLQIQGCAHRAGDLRRTETVEESTARILEKIADLGDTLADHQVAVTKQVGEINTEMVRKVSGIKIWVLTSCAIVLLATLSVVLKDTISKLLG